MCKALRSSCTRSRLKCRQIHLTITDDQSLGVLGSRTDDQLLEPTPPTRAGDVTYEPQQQVEQQNEEKADDGPEEQILVPGKHSFVDVTNKWVRNILNF